MNAQSCATCRHHTAIGAPIHSACADCIQGGACTRWEMPEGKAQIKTIRKEVIEWQK